MVFWTYLQRLIAFVSWYTKAINRYYLKRKIQSKAANT